MDMKICVLAGDGIGPEITEQAVRVLETVCTVKKISLTRTDALIGGAAIDAGGRAASGRNACKVPCG